MLITLVSSWFNYVAAQFVTRGDAAKLSGKCFRITPNQEFRYGTLWWDQKIDLTKPIELNFIIFLGNKDANGADGIAFLFHDDPRGFNATGDPGGGLGFGQYERSDKIQPSVAIEFDTWQNQDITSDIASDHTTVVYNGNIFAPELQSVSIDPNNSDVENNQCHIYTITWNPALQELKLFFDGQERFNHKDDLINHVFNGKSLVYYGFTGSTGGSTNDQTVCIIDNSSKSVAKDDQAATEPNTPTTIPVLNNDSHTAGEAIHLTRIVNQPKNGTAEVAGNNIRYTAQVGFEGNDQLTYEVCDVSASACYASCATATVNIAVACKDQPAPTITSGSTTELCTGSSITLTASAASSYTWSTGETTQSITVDKAGIYSVKVKYGTGCESPATTLKITELPLPIFPSAGSATRCGSGRLLLTASGGANGTYRWYTSLASTTPIPGATNSQFETPELTAGITYYVAIKAGTCESRRVPVQAMINPLPAIQTSLPLTISKGQSVLIKASGGATYSWSPAETLSDPSSSTPVAKPNVTTLYTVKVKTKDNCEATADVLVTVQNPLAIPNTFSPNGDGINETWEIGNIATYPNAKVQIFNRWGNNIYTTTGYQTNWNGTYQGKLLPLGTYYYLIDIGEGTIFSGSVTIIR